MESARLLISQWRNATRTQVVYSYAQGADDVPLRPSALLPDIAVEVLPAASTAGLPPRLLQLPPNSLERTDDTRLLPVAEITGASRLIEQQATCPFQAFAASRLHLKPLENPGFGLSPAALGTLIHEVLRHLWLQLEDTRTLAGLDEPQLQLHVDKAVAAGLDRLARRYPLTLTPGLRELEKDRLSALMHAWLEVERKRGTFRVLATETATHWQYRGLQLNLKLDRVDLQDGARVVIDYKTGSLPGNTWGNTSPRQFQLLLYLSALEQQSTGPQVRALLFAALHPAKMKYSGIAADDGMLAELDMHNGRLQVPESDWDALRERWQQELGSLALEILDGYAAVVPRQGDSCRYCDFGPLCRIDELRGLA